MMFRELSEAETAEFREWARKNYTPGTEINPVWHPIIQEECKRMNAETASAATPRQIAQWYMQTAEKREVSYNKMDDVYLCSYDDAAEAAGVPEPWRNLVVCMLMAGYVEFDDWAQAQLD